MTMRLLDAASSPFSSRCRMVVYAKDDGPVTIIEPPGGLYSDAYKSFHPFVKIPTLDLGLDSGDMLQESDVICEYLDDVLTGPTLKPEDPLARARMRLIARVADLYVMAPMMPLFKQLDPTTRDADVVTAELEAMMSGYDKLAFYLTGAPYAVGGSLSLADCTLVPSLVLTLDFLPRFDVDSPLETRPNVHRYWQGICQDPVAARVIKKMRDKLAEYRAKKNA